MTVLVLVYISSLLPLAAGQLQWEQVTNYSDPSVTYPQPRRDSAIGYDSAREQVILFGGRTSVNRADIILGDTWIFDLSTGE